MTPVVERHLHALLHGRDEDGGDHAALHLVDELEAAAARERLDLEVDLAELAGAAGLLLVPAVALGLLRDRLAVGDLGRLGVDLQLVLRGHLLELHAHVQLAQAAHHRLVRGGVALDPQAGILDLQLVQHLEEALLVALLLRLHRDGVHRRREVQRAQADVVLVVRVVQHGVELDLVDLRDGAQVAREELVHLHVVLALDRIEVAHLERALAVADVELGVLRDGALVHAEEGHLAHVRVHHDLEDVREHVLRAVGHGVEFLALGGLALHEGRRVALRRVGRELRQDVAGTRGCPRPSSPR